MGNGSQFKSFYKAQSCACASCRYSAFLDGVVRHEPLSHDFFHAYPQAIKTNIVGPPFDAVVKLEELEDGLASIAAVLGLAFLRNLSGFRVRDSGNTAKSSRCCTGVDLRNDTSLLSRLCHLYAVDFTCFGYKRPHGCAVPPSTPMTGKTL
jgi:hypothetical protein